MQPASPTKAAYSTVRSATKSSGARGPDNGKDDGVSLDEAAAMIYQQVSGPAAPETQAAKVQWPSRLCTVDWAALDCPPLSPSPASKTILSIVSGLLSVDKGNSTTPRGVVDDGVPQLIVRAICGITR